MSVDADDIGPASAAIRANAVSFRGDPFTSTDALLYMEDALVLCRDGAIEEFGPYESVRHRVQADVDVHHYPGMLLCAGFVDTHVHYVQTRVVASYGTQLIDWLRRYAFIEEQRFSDEDYAAEVAKLFFDQLLANGTTTAAVFCATCPQSVNAFFEESLRRGTRMIGGKVLMDRNAPQPLLDAPETSYEDSHGLIARWHDNGRNSYAISPRFAPTSSPEQLDVAHDLWSAHPGTYLQTHIAESLDEINWVGELFPQAADYLDVYDHHGLLGPRAILAHGVHLDTKRFERIHQADAALAHCPTSNLFLGSGLFDLRSAKLGRDPVRVGLGTDIGAGTSFSLLATMADAYKVSQLQGFAMSGAQLLFLATLGAAHALQLGGVIGSLTVGKEADFVILDPFASALLAERTRRAESVDDVLFAMAILGDERAVRATYVGGSLVHSRSHIDPVAASHASTGASEYRLAGK